MHLTGSTTIGRPPQDVYDFWRPLEHLPTFMAHLDDVRRLDDDRSHWTATAPFGRTVEWDAVTTEDVPGERMAWESVEGADIRNSGVVHFRPAPGGRGTEVRVELDYDVPAGKLGQLVAATSVRSRTSSSTTTCAVSSRSSRPARSCGRTGPRAASRHVTSSRNIRPGP